MKKTMTRALLLGAILPTGAGMADTYPAEAYPPDATIEALDGSTDSGTGLAFVPKGTTPNSSPTYEVQYNRRLARQNAILATVNQGRVVDESGLTFGVFPVIYYLDATRKAFAGATAQSAIDDDTTHVWIDDSNTLASGTNGFPADETTFLPLAAITTAGGDITAIADERGAVLFHVPDVPGGGYAAAGSNSDITSISGLTTPMSVTQGGTGATAAAAARSNLAAAASGANSDITSVSGLTTALSVPQGGTGATTAAAARSNLTAAASGANSDITSVSGLTTALSVPQGGTGATTAAAGRSNLGAAASGANSDITSVNGLTTALTVAQGGTGQTAANVVPYSPSVTLGGTLSVKVYEVEWVAPVAFTLLSATGRVATAPVGDTLIVDVRVNGSSIFTNQTEMINVAAGTQQDESAAKNHAVTAGQVITIEVEQIGSSTAGSDLTVVIDGRTALQT